AQTEELGNRTAALKDREEKLDHVQRLALTTIISDLRSQTEGQERRVRSAFYRAFYKKEARRDAGSLLQRIDQLSSGLAEMKSADVSPYVEQLQELRKRIEQVSARVK
ncbi:MAG TPA: hypothetical protein VJX67_25910, partial [Blastocatellia bacterium]|nr:hypothetical protein [Blastocatellia bacterium]